jgi:tetratricopeptide (TPR) repeat protein
VILFSLENGEDGVAVHTYYEVLFQKLPLELPPDSLYALAGALGRDDRLDDSLEVYQKLLKEAPQSELAPKAVLRCAETFTKMGRYQLAMSAYEHLLSRYDQKDWRDTVEYEMDSLRRKMYGH